MSDGDTARATAHEQLDEWLRREFVAEYGPVGEQKTWPVVEVTQIMDRLNAVRRDRPTMAAEILWLREVTAFTVPGRYVYVSRRLIERCPSDDPVAFALAHEMAHHDLGHLHGIDEAVAAVPRHVPGLYSGRLALLAAAMLIEKRVHGPEHEADADARALELCVAAGYGGSQCLQLFDLLETYALDHGDVNAVFGLEDVSDPAARDEHPWLLEARVWAWERLHGYMPLRERKDRLRVLLTEMTSH